jgi:hypothetical protein
VEGRELFATCSLGIGARRCVRATVISWQPSDFQDWIYPDTTWPYSESNTGRSVEAAEGYPHWVVKAKLTPRITRWGRGDGFRTYAPSCEVEYVGMIQTRLSLRTPGRVRSRGFSFDKTALPP